MSVVDPAAGIADARERLVRFAEMINREPDTWTAVEAGTILATLVDAIAEAWYDDTIRGITDLPETHDRRANYLASVLGTVVLVAPHLDPAHIAPWSDVKRVLQAVHDDRSIDVDRMERAQAVIAQMIGDRTSHQKKN